MLLRAMWFILGSVAMVFAAIGVLLPVLPTTPFALLAVFAYGKSAPGIAASIQRNRFLGLTLMNWREHGAIAPRHKAIAVIMMAIVFGASVAMSVTAPILVLQGLCMTGAAALSPAARVELRDNTALSGAYAGRPPEDLPSNRGTALGRDRGPDAQGGGDGAPRQ